jgi:hypothetical protein
VNSTLKRFFVIILIIILSLFTGCTYNPYHGNYLYNGDANIVLQLNNNYSFQIITTIGKNDSYIENGKYSVDNNTITLIFNNNSTKSSNNKTLTGKVTGSEIKINSFTEPFIKE